MNKRIDEIQNILDQHGTMTGDTTEQDVERLEEELKALQSNAGVPPAGDVEVFSMKYGEQPTEEDGRLVRHADHLAVVTRLTAERDGLKEENLVLNRWLATARKERDLAQSELTKARELLTEAMGILQWGENGTPAVICAVNISRYLEGKLSNPIPHNVDESCGQDAEADRNTEWEDTFGPDYTGEDAEAAKCNGSGFNCCKPTAEENALLKAGDYTPEELWGGPRPTCPKCIGGVSTQQIGDVHCTAHVDYAPDPVARLHVLLNERDEKIRQLESAKAMALKWLAERDEAILKQKGKLNAIRKILNSQQLADLQGRELEALAYSKDIRDLLDQS